MRATVAWRPASARSISKASSSGSVASLAPNTIAAAAARLVVAAAARRPRPTLAAAAAATMPPPPSAATGGDGARSPSWHSCHSSPSQRQTEGGPQRWPGHLTASPSPAPTTVAAATASASPASSTLAGSPLQPSPLAGSHQSPADPTPPLPAPPGSAAAAGGLHDAYTPWLRSGGGALLRRQRDGDKERASAGSGGSGGDLGGGRQRVSSWLTSPAPLLSMTRFFRLEDEEADGGGGGGGGGDKRISSSSSLKGARASSASPRWSPAPAGMVAVASTEELEELEEEDYDDDDDEAEAFGDGGRWQTPAGGGRRRQVLLSEDDDDDDDDYDARGGGAGRSSKGAVPSPSASPACWDSDREEEEEEDSESGGGSSSSGSSGTTAADSDSTFDASDVSSGSSGSSSPRSDDEVDDDDDDDDGTPARNHKKEEPAIAAAASPAAAAPADDGPGGLAFARRRERLARELYAEWNEVVFGGRLPPDLAIVWNPRLRCTAGQVVDDRSLDAQKIDPRSRSERVACRLELSPKVIDRERRLRDTLAHEMAHVGAWTIERDFERAHGPTFQRWARAFEAKVLDVRITTRHSYAPSVPQQRWSCQTTSCGKIYSRSKKTIDEKRHVCSVCRGRLIYVGKFDTDGQLLVAGPGGDASAVKPKRALNAFGAFVKDNYAETKSRGGSHADVMSNLSARWTAMKLGGGGSGGAE